MLCKTCETIIPDNEAQCTKCGNNPKVLNDKWYRPISKRYRIALISIGITSLIFDTTTIFYKQGTHFFIIGMSALLLHFAMMIIISVRVKKRQLWAMDWAMVGLILPIVPAICLDRMTKKQEDIIMYSVNGVLILALIGLFVFREHIV